MVRRRGPADSAEKQQREREALMLDIKTGRIAPPEARLASQLREMLGKWDRIFKEANECL
jgi:hypothetical protein